MDSEGIEWAGLYFFDSKSNLISSFGASAEGDANISFDNWKDKQGHTRLGMDSHGRSSLQFIGGGGLSAELVGIGSPPSLTLFDRNGKLRAKLGVDNDGPSLVFNDSSEKPRTALGVETGGSPSLALFDVSGKTIWSAPTK